MKMCLFFNHTQKKTEYIKKYQVIQSSGHNFHFFFLNAKWCCTGFMFIEFGVPVPLAVSLALTFFMIGPITWLNVNHLFDTGGMSHFALAFQEDFEKAVKQNQGFLPFYQNVFFKIAFVVLYYFCILDDSDRREQSKPNVRYVSGFIDHFVMWWAVDKSNILLFNFDNKFIVCGHAKDGANC